MVASLFFIALVALISAVSCAFEFKCSAYSSTEKLKALEEEAKLMLEKTPKIWYCGQKFKDSFDFSTGYKNCISSINLPASYDWSTQILYAEVFSSQERFKSEIENIGNMKCNESSYRQTWTSEMKGGSFEEDNNTTMFISVGVVVLFSGIIIAVIMYRNKKAKEAGEVTLPTNNAYPPNVNNSYLLNATNNSYPSINPNQGPYAPYQYPQNFAPNTNPYFAPNNFGAATTTPSYPQYQTSQNLAPVTGYNNLGPTQNQQ